MLAATMVFAVLYAVDVRARAESAFSQRGLAHSQTASRAQVLTLALRGASVAVALVLAAFVGGNPEWLRASAVAVLVALSAVELRDGARAPVLYHSGAPHEGRGHSISLLCAAMFYFSLVGASDVLRVRFHVRAVLTPLAIAACVPRCFVYAESTNKAH